MTDFVVDASAVLSWIVPTQATEAAVAFLAARDTQRFLAPYIMDWEIGNVLLTLLRRGALAPRDFGRARQEVITLSIEAQPPLAAETLDDLLVVSFESRLSLFDMSYLNLAVEEGAALVSRDRQLLEAAARRGVECINLVREAAR